MTGDDARDQTRDEIAVILNKHASEAWMGGWRCVACSFTVTLDDPKGAETWRGHHADLLAAYVSTKQAEVLEAAAADITPGSTFEAYPVPYLQGRASRLRARAVREA